MEKKITTIENKSLWLRSFKLGDVKTGYFENPNELHSFSVLLSRFNMTEARPNGLNLSANYDYFKKTVTVTAKESHYKL